ncbi:polysaccharide deacetylase family protein [Pseudomonas knackmussii B13]|uniref:Polysaccharide deacetylase family protein n=1 Tax=Pseudomonas knackmussii (strain DSM 6978 / CCUG 54928 / LMG 23759 / B13) TaxID=1301098 RepID=A0A024HGW7_PSEKB|nr:polysaccharide deacetylase family protein [Pseudomonas knackmussii]CDF84091.1 polysaccharide deacetylase family protein [Pseudomonas knackmussii B13]
MRQQIKRLAGTAYLHSPMGRRRLRGAGVVLMLHRVLADDSEAALPHRRALCIGRQSFEHLLQWLGRHFDCVPLAELLERPHGARPRVALSFDDGWRDNAEQAFPLLQRYGMPASIFLSTDFIGSHQRFWWEAIGEGLWRDPAAVPALIASLAELGHPLPALLREPGHSAERSAALAAYLQQLKALAPTTLQQLADSCPPAPHAETLDWSQVRDLEASGLVRFGPHGASHSILTQLDGAALAEDLERSRRTLAEHCAQPLAVYCYPNGDHSPQVREAVAALGYRHALATRPGLVDGRSEALGLPRIDVGQQAARDPSLLAWRIFRGAQA